MSTVQANTVSPLALTPGKPFRVALWVAQGLIAVLFCMSAAMKLLTPIPELSAMMPWTGQFPVGIVRAIGMIDLAGGIGILLPALTRIRPRLTVLAAVGCVVLQVFAMSFHAYRGEFSVMPLNVVLFTLSVFVLWGRAKKAPIAPRR